MSVLRRQDFIDDDVFTALPVLQKQLETIISSAKTMRANIGGGASKQAEDTKKLTVAEQELSKVAKQLEVQKARQTDEYIKQQQQLVELRKKTKDLTETENQQLGTLEKLAIQNRKLTEERRKLDLATSQGKTRLREINSELDKNNKFIQKNSDALGKQKINIGNYKSALQGLGVTFLSVTGAVAAFFGILKSSLNIIRDYTKANATLAGVMGTTVEQNKKLQDQQKALGATTAYTAGQVANAQTELARLGKTQQEIINLTPSLLDAALAMGVDLAQAAELVAGQLNAFNLESKEGARVGDVLVKATQISAFNFDRLKMALGTVSPAANAVNASIEDTVAVLTSAVDANIDAGTAATALRNIYIDLSDKGISWQNAMNQINTATDKLSKANELFGKRGAVVATVIADNTDKINKNREALLNAEGAAKEFAEKTLATLDGKLKLLTSAYEGLILSIDEGNGIISKAAGAFTDLGTSMLTMLTEINKFTGSERLGFWEKLGTLLGLASGQAGAYAAAMTKIVATNAVDDFEKQSDAIDEVKKTIKKTTTAVEQHEKVIGELYDMSARYTNFQQSAFLNEIDDWKKKTALIKGIEEKLADDRRKINKDLAKTNEDARKEELKRDKELADTKNEIIKSGVELSKEIFGGFTDLRIQQIQQELNEIEFARNRELQLAEGNAQAQDAINKKYDKEARKLKRDQIKAERANSIFNILMNTAMGIANAASKVVTIPLIPFIAGIGAVQTAAVLAAQMPKYEKGTKSSKPNYIAGEAGPELRKSKGKWSMVDKPTVFYNSPGDQIVSTKQTDSIIGNLIDVGGENMLTDKRKILALLNNEYRMQKSENVGYILKRNNDELIRTIQNKKETSISVNTKNIKVYERSGNTIVNRIDHYYNR